MTPGAELASFAVASGRVRDVASHSLRPTTRPGSDVVSLASGEPDFDTPPHICRALVEAVNGGATHYGAWDGDPELREALAAHVSGGGRRERSAGNVLVTHGGSAALAAVALAFIDPNDKVVIPAPTYSLYADHVRLAGGEPVLVPQSPDLQLDLDAIAAAAPGARMVVICNPCNPTGAVYPRQQLTQLAAIAEEHDLLVVCDEAYDQIVYRPERFTSSLDIPELADRLLYAQTFSKTYAMTGWRVGYLVADTEMISAAALAHRSIAGPVNTAVQRAALAAVIGDQDPVDDMLREYSDRRTLVLALLEDIPALQAREPDGTFFVFARHSSAITSLEMTRRARANGVAVRPGSEFGPGGEGYIRLSFATGRDRLERGLELLRGAVGEA